MSVTINYRSLVTFVAGVTAAVVAVFAFQSLSADAAAGDTDATFVAITPCRLIDTRPGDGRVGPHGAFGASETKTVVARGTNGTCTIPSDAVGLSLNVTAVGATAPSFLTIWPDGDLPKASSLNPAPGQPPTPNAVTSTLSATGSFNVFNKAGNVDVIIDVNGFYTNTSLKDLDQRLVALETAGVPDGVLARLEALEAKTAAMSIEDAGSTVRFTGVDVQIVDGSADTQCNASGFEACNGSGNLIVGYNEDNGTVEARSGSHNIVTGFDNDYQSHSGIIAGRSNTSSGEYATITGGVSNTASGSSSSVSGGDSNTASGSSSSVSGGVSNTASGSSSSVSGGTLNSASGLRSSVSGGVSNVAEGSFSSVMGGRVNRAVGTDSSVSGGTLNTASGTAAAVTAGSNNTARAVFSSISGGQDNETGASYSSILGGQSNRTANSPGPSIGGGDDILCGRLWSMCGEGAVFAQD